MNTNISIAKDKKIIYTTRPSNDTFCFVHNNLTIHTEYYDKLIQSFFTKRLLDSDILPLQYNQSMITQTPLPPISRLKSVNIFIQEELLVVSHSNKVYCQSIGIVSIKKLSKNLKLDYLENSKRISCKVEDTICFNYRRKDVLPVKVMVCSNRIVVESREPNVSNFLFNMPVKDNVYHVNFKCNKGTASFDLSQGQIVWSIKNISVETVELGYELCITNNIKPRDKQMVAKVDFEIDPLKNSGIDILRVYDDEGVKDGYVRKKMIVRKYEIRF